jgi:hypothetical protein
MVPSVITFDEVKSSPSVRMDVPALLSIGERILLHFVLRRQNGPRSEELRIEGEFRVTEAVIDATCAPIKQRLKVSAKGVTPSWKAVKRSSVLIARKLAPTHTRSVIE